MKKIIFVLMTLLVTSPVFAVQTVSITFTADANIISHTAAVQVHYSNPGPVKVRAFGLDLKIVGDANITAVQCVNGDYKIHPGSIVIDSGGVITSYGSCLCSKAPNAGYPLPKKATTIEMGSLGVVPADSNVLATFSIAGIGTVDINAVANAIRGGIVLDDATAAIVNVTPLTGVNLGTNVVLTCWTITECAGQPNGDATCDGAVNLGDLIALKAAFGSGAPWVGNKCCADFDHSGAVNLGDLIKLKSMFGTGGYAPSTLRQNCPL